MSILERKDLKEINRNDILLSFSLANYKSRPCEFYKDVFDSKDGSSVRILLDPPT